MSRLIVLSNRVKSPNNGPMAGGLAIALHDLLIESSGIWMGWNSDIVNGSINSDNDFATYEFSHHPQSDLVGPAIAGTDLPSTDLLSSDTQLAHSKTTYVTTALTTEQYQHFYCGFANSVLWPLLHERTDLIHQVPQDYAGYQAVNRLFAKQLKKISQPDDVIWVHDYHFLSVAYYCRQLGMGNRIGFFLHIPFAPLAVWQQLDQSLELIKHLAHYDVLGTQTEHGKANCLKVFRYYLKDYLLNNASINTFQKKRQSTRLQQSMSTRLMLNLKLESTASHCLTINAYPIGVNVKNIQKQVSHLTSYVSSQATNHTRKVSNVKPANQQIIAVDRIDYSKGLLARFLAYQSFLRQYPIYQDQLSLLQIACPSRLDLPVYQRLYNDVRQTVNRVNQQFSSSEHAIDAVKTNALEANSLDLAALITDNTDNWRAINYSESVLSHEKLMKAFHQSDVGWVNSFKDGMNLVAKEYIAAQNPDNPGVLLLSRYAGAAEQMQAAVIIDPHQPESIIQGLKMALTMPLAQRKSRYQTLLKGLQQDNLYAWQQDFLDDLYGSASHQIDG